METFTRKNRYNFNKRGYQRPQASYFERHLHDYYEFILFKSGNVHIIIEESCYYPQMNDLFILPPGVYHYLDVVNDERPYDRFVLQFDKTPLDEPFLKDSFINSRCLNLSSAPEILEWFDRFHAYMENYPDEQFSKIDRALICEFLMLLSKQAKTLTKEKMSHETNLAVKTILDYIEENFVTIQSVEDITNALYISKTYLFHCFKKYLKISPMHYIQGKKLMYARQLIKNGEKPTTVNKLCGIPEYTTFFRLYKKQFGFSPSKKY